MMTNREYTENLLNALEMLVQHFRYGHPIDWSIVPLKVQTETMHIANGIGARLFIKNIWKGPMSNDQRVDLAKGLEDTIEAVAALDVVFS